MENSKKERTLKKLKLMSLPKSLKEKLDKIIEEDKRKLKEKQD